jgi:hypothetical protein
MKRIYKLGNQLIEMWHDEPPENERYGNQFALWCGIMLTILNILAAILVCR